MGTTARGLPYPESTAFVSAGAAAIESLAVATQAEFDAASSAYVPAVIAAGPGIDPTGVADSTAAVQALINSVPYGGRLHFPAGRYKLGALTTTTELTISGEGQAIRLQPQYGDAAQWGPASTVGGSVLVFTNTTGASITAPALTQIHLRDLAMIGPGSGTSRGFQVGTSSGVNGVQVDNVLIGNYAVGVYGYGLFNARLSGLHVVGCDIGIDLYSSNGNTFTGLVIETCLTFGVRIDGAENLFAGGVFQGNSGTVVKTNHAGAAANHFLNVYMENSTATFAVDFALGDYNMLSNIHISGTSANGRRVVLTSNNNWIINPKAIGAVTLTGAGNFLMGIFSYGITNTGANNVIFDTASTQFSIGDKAFRIGTGKTLFLQHNGDANFIKRDANTGNTQVGGAFALAGQATTTVAPAAGAAGALPATPAGYLTVEINGVSRKIAYY